jgi:chromosome segregation ATPase
MSFTPTDFHDLVRLVEEHPEWRTELRRLVLTDSLLALPEQVTELRLETDRRFQELAAAQQRTEARVIELTTAQQRTDTQVASLIQQVADLIAVQRRQTEQISELTIAQRRTEEQLAALTQQVAQLVYVTQTLVTDVGTLKGDMLELRYRNRAASYLGRIARRMRTLSADELAELLDEAVDQGQLSIAEKDEIMLADLVVRGRRRDDDTAVYLLVEVSWSIGPYDVERAVKRAALLSRLGTPVLPVVAGQIMPETVEQLAREQKVWQVTDGRAVAPET